jgi:glutamate racemase
MQNSAQPIGVFDSGLGGLTVFGELTRTLPQERFIYLGDMARTPYGSKSRETIIRYSRECSAFLLEQGVKIIVVACNTASSLALEALQAELPCPVIGTVEQAAKCALQATRSKRIGVIGTEATISSGVYQARLQQLEAGVSVFSQPCPLFVPLVEQGMVSGEIVEKVVELYLRELRSKEIDTLILGCTHYPVLAPVLQDFLGEKVCIVECSKAIASEVREMLGAESGNETRSEAESKFYVTDSLSRFRTLAPIFLRQTRTEFQAEKIELTE